MAARLARREFGDLCIVLRNYAILAVEGTAQRIWHYRRTRALFEILLQLLIDLAGIVSLAVRRYGTLAGEIVMLCRQLALYVERGVKPRRGDPVTRATLALLSRFFNWRDALVVVCPETMIRWYRARWRLFWSLKSRPGRPTIPRQV